MWKSADVRKLIATLSKPDVSVTNESDKKEQLKRIKELVEDSRTACRYILRAFPPEKRRRAPAASKP